ncbi:Ig-like domain repeat protein [uncultured Methanobrevibacter sp.]|uniref:Ig-like domain repeat protein n=1 Tax=uncultured Methanobrevibacter sp. TaxID=253161 RepID=UPI002602F3D2
MWKGSNGLIEYSNFTNNHANSGRGGAVYLADNENGTVVGCNFSSNYAYTNGGAVDWHEGAQNGALINSTFESNVAGRSGGAVYWNGHNGTINGTNFTFNKAMGEHKTTGQEDGGDGGAVIWTGSYGDVNDCDFTNNTASRRGGAIYLQKNVHDEDYCMNTSVSTSTFINNTAGTNGGAIDWFEGAVNGKVINSTFENNTALDGNGGSIFWNGVNGTIDGCNFTSNKAIGQVIPGKGSQSRGGAVFVNGTNSTIANSTFQFNYAGNNGSAIVFENSYNGKVLYSNFTNNTAGLNAGAICFAEGALYGEIIGSNFINNTANGSAGAIGFQGSFGIVSNSSFINNTALGQRGNDTGRGASVVILGNSTQFSNCSFEGGISYNEGSAIYIRGNNATIADSNFTKNQAISSTRTDSSTGEDYYTSGSGTININGNNASIISCKFDENNATYMAGAIYISGANASLNLCNFTNNYADNDGGALYITGENATLANSTFTNNTAGDDGGAVNWIGDYGRLYNVSADLNRGLSIFKNNHQSNSKGGSFIIQSNYLTADIFNITNSYAEQLAGGLFLTGNYVNLSNIYFENCTTNSTVGYEGNHSGGAMNIVGNHTRIINATIENCLAYEGGAIYWEGNDGYVENITISNSNATEDGAGIYLTGNNTNISDIDVNNCIAKTGSGGAVYISGIDATIDYGNFINNTAKIDGGAIYLTDNKEGYIYHAYFENNTAGRKGGAINFYAGAEDGLVSSCEFVDNIANASGGAIYWEGTRGVIEYSNFTGSRATGTNTEGTAIVPNNGRGGSVIWLGDRGEVRECSFNDSQSKNEGSVLYIIGDDFAAYNSNFTNSLSIEKSGTVYIEGTYAKIGDCYMDNNTVKERGAGIFVKGNFISISGTAINNSTSGITGSAVYVEGNRTEIKDSIISNNHANVSGAIYIAGSRSTVSNVNFENNTATVAGAAIYINGNDTLVTKSNLTNNSAFQGGGIYYTGQRITISYSNFDRNSVNGTTADTKGGSIYIVGKSGDSIIGCNFTDSYALSSGGSICWVGGGEGGLIQNCSFINSTTEGISGVSGAGHGGAIVWESNLNGLIDNCTFIDCVAQKSKNAGAIYMGVSGNPAVNPTISNCLIVNCSNGERGVINIHGINATLYNITLANLSGVATSDKGFHAIEFENLITGRIVNCTFENITGDYSGGAIKIDAGSNIVIANNTFINVNATTDGGAIYSTDVSGEQVLENNTFINAHAQNGGAIYFKNMITSFKNNTFVNNSLFSSSGRGGAVYLLAEGIVIDNSTFINNTGAFQGGAIFSSKQISLINSYFESNIANGGTSNIKGGVLFVDGGDVIVDNSTFIANSALHSGGALYLNNMKTVYVSNSTFLHNTAPAYDGGAIYAGAVYINESSLFMYNNASRASAIFARSAYINDTILLENQAHFRQWANQYNKINSSHVNISGIFRGEDTLLNAILLENDNYEFHNLTYCGVNGEQTNTDEVTSARSYNEVYQLIVLEIYNDQNDLVDTIEQYTDANGRYTFDFDLADASNYAFKVYHPEDNYYTSSEYTISKALPIIEIQLNNITHPEDELINFTVSGTAGTPQGNLSIVINDSNGNIIYEGLLGLSDLGTAQLNLERLNVSHYNVSVRYNGDENYIPVNTSGEFDVYRGESYLNIDIDNYTYNETRNITISMPLVEEGILTVLLSNDEYSQLYTFYLENMDSVKIELAILDSNEYNVYAVFRGNNNYYPCENETNFTVFKAASIIDVNVEDVVGGQRATADIHVSPEIATQTVRLIIYDEEGNELERYDDLGLSNSRVSQILSLLPKGSYNATVYYAGDRNHKESENSTLFNVSNDLFPIDIEAIDLIYGQDQIINITVPIGADASKLWIKVNWTENDTLSNLGYSFVDGLIQIDTSSLANRLAVANYTIDVYYEGDENYLSNSSAKVFEIIPADIEMTISPQNISYGSIENITIEIPILSGIGQDEALILYVNSTTNESIRFEIEDYDIDSEGKAVWNISESILPAGDYIVEAVYKGSSNYNPANGTALFTVSKAMPWIEIDLNNIYVGESEIINITVYPNGLNGVTGNVTIYVRDKIETLILNESSEATFTLNDEIEGTGITVVVNYAGDNNFYSVQNSSHYNVTKQNTTITVDALSPISYGTIEDINASVNFTDASGTIILYINSSIAGFDNITKVFNIGENDGGKVNWDIDELVLAVGEYDVIAVYSGDRKYNNSTSQTKLIVVNQNSSYQISVEANNTVYGEDQIIIVSLPEDANGTVTIVIEGFDISLTANAEDGHALFVIPSGEYDYLSVHENYKVIATYNGDSNYAAGNTAEDLFNVTKADVDESNRFISAVNITYGDDETITVTLNEHNIIGNITISINGVEIETKELADGKAVFTVPNDLFSFLEVNEYNVIANYSGDANYNGFAVSENLNADFTVSKANVTVTVDTESIPFKETENVNIAVAGVIIDASASGVAKYNLTGNVVIYVDGIVNQTVAIASADENGILHIAIEGLAVGSHNITAKYCDDRNYNEKNNTGEFEVLNALPENMEIAAQNITYHIQNESVSVDLGEVLNGTVQLFINGLPVQRIGVLDKSSVEFDPISDLEVGNYTAKIVFAANDDSVEASLNFTVSKAPTVIDIMATDSTYGKTQIITVSLDNTVSDKFNLTGNVSIRINGVDYGNKTLDTNGQAVFEVDGLEARENYEVIAYYYNDSNYEDNNTNRLFAVNKADVELENRDISAVNITYGDDETITVTLNEYNITGKITIIINDTLIETKELANGQAVFTVPNDFFDYLEVNGYNVIANYSGDVNYNGFDADANLNTDFTVSPANSTVKVEAIPSIVYGNNETLTVTVPIRNHTGTITLTINGSDYKFIKHLTAEDSDSVTLNDLGGLAVGRYNVSVKYDDDRNYNPSEDSVLFEVIKAVPLNVGVEAQNISYTEDEIITVTVLDENATGSIRITIPEISYTDTKDLESGIAKFNISGLVVAYYSVIANYSGDANYSSAEVSTIFHVDKAASNVAIEVNDIVYNEVEYANISIPNYNASGRVIIKIDGNDYAVRNLDNETPINLEVDGLAVGEHSIELEYFDDDNYNKSFARGLFNVTKDVIPVDPTDESSLIVVPEDIVYLDDEIILVSVGVNNATGNVTVKINGTDIVLTKNITEDGGQSVSFNVSGLVVGEYNVTVDYTDDANYKDATTSGLFNVAKAPSAVEIEVEDIVYLDNETIKVTVPIINASGTIVVKVNGSKVNETSFNGVDSPSVTLIVPGLAVGEYNVTVEYSNDVNYNDSESSALFNVAKRNITDVEGKEGMTVVPANITYLNNETVVVSIDVPNATGIVTIKINGTDIELSKNIAEEGSQSISFTVEGLVVANYTVTAYYSDDVNYNDAELSANFTVDKAASSVELEVANPIVYNDNETIAVTVPITNASGTLVVKVNGSKVNETRFDGVDSPSVTLIVPGLAVGEYNVTAEYINDVNYNDSESSALFNVTKAEIPVDPDNASSLIVVPEDIVYLDDEIILVSVGVNNATGNVTVRINGTDIVLTKNITEEGSQSVTFNVSGLVVGEYNVTVDYTDDANYKDATTSGLFNVAKAPSALEIEVEDIIYGANETIAISVPITNASGTIVVKVNGIEINRTSFDSEDLPLVEILIEKPSVAQYNVSVEYIDDVNYLDSNNSSIFTVSKADPSEAMDIIATNVTYGSDVIVNVTVPADASGNITIRINDYTDTIEITAGETIVSFTVPDLEVNNYVVYANYSGDANYNSAIVNTPFHVDKAESHISVMGIDIVYGDDETITVVVSDKNATGFVTITINGTDVNETKAIGNGTVEFTIKDLVVDEYNITALYHDDRNYLDSESSGIFIVSRAAVKDMSVNPVNISYGDNETIVVEILDNNLSGIVTINVNGSEYGPVEIENGRAEFIVPGLVVGDYNVIASYSGDDNYNGSTAENTFVVEKAKPSVYVVAANIDYGDDELITVIVDGLNLTGNVTIKVNGSEYETKDIDERGRAVFNISGLNAGEYEAVAVYNGDVNHKTSDGQDPFNVSRVVPDLNVTAEDIDYGDNETITVTLPEDATGTVNITVDNVTYPDVPIVNGTASVTVPGIVPGEHNVTVDYPGDENYNATSTNESFTVDKVAPSIDIETEDIDYGADETIAVTVNPVDGGVTPTGTVNITVADKDGNVLEFNEIPLVNGSASIVVPGLSAGEYDVDVVYNGDDNYLESNASDGFDVARIVPDLDLAVEDIDYGDNETITVTLPEDATGTVNITVDNVTYPDVPIVNGTASVTVPGIVPGEHNVTVDYPGDENYNATSTNESFTVDKVAPTVDLDTKDISYGEDEPIAVTVNPVEGGVTPTGTVNITVNGVTYTDIPLVNGSASISVPDLAAGEYPVEIAYGGDDNYLASEANGSFAVSQIIPEIDLECENITYGDNETITVTVPENATGTVNITIDNVTYPDVPIENGTAIITVPNITAGEHNVTVEYPGDENYTGSNVTTSFTVDKANAEMDIDTENITYGEDEGITVSLSPVDGGITPTGTVNISVIDKDGVKHQFVDVAIEDGKAIIDVTDLAAGNYTVEAVYSGDANYNINELSSEFEVGKAVPHIEILVEDIIYGDVEVITVTCDAPGTVDVIVNGVTITVSLDEGYEKRVFASILHAYSGKATIDLVNLAVGTYPAIARYNGNENYSSVSDNDTFHVIQAPTVTKISVEDIKVGEDAVINVEVDHDRGSEIINSNITVSLDGKDYTVEIRDGKGSLTVSDLSAGIHTVKAAYPGSHNYTESSNQTNFTVSKNTPGFDISTEDIKVGENETITVTVPEDATGNVTITIDGKDYTAPVENGTAVFVIPGIKAGEHDVNASYSGDDKYSPAKGNSSFDVSKVKPSIDVDAPTIKEGENGTIVVTVPEDATGTITIEVDGKNYTATIKNAKAVFHIPGLDAGKHGIKVFYSGDDKYLASSIDGGNINVIAKEHKHEKLPSKAAKEHKGIDLASKNTGNPILVLMLVLFGLVIIPFKRSKDEDEEEED